jgi:hypothetical protein
VFKKALKIVGAFALLTAGYVAYGCGFGLLAEAISPPRPARPEGPDGTVRPQSAQEADRLAARGFGKGHWSADPDGSIRYYDRDRGFWIYFKDYERSADGKRLHLHPFAVIWQAKPRSKDEPAERRALKTLSAREAFVDFDGPFELLNKTGAGSPKVVHAQVDGDLLLRDDNGTATPADDLIVDRLTTLIFDGLRDEIRSESPVRIRNRDLTATADAGLKISLRPKVAPGRPSGAPGFNGAQTAFLYKNVHITVKDVGRSGIVPGGQGSTRGGPKPGDIQCDGEMRIDLPPPRPRVPCGPPAPSEPTLVQFSRNVRVRQGGPEPAQCDSDQLYLILLPADELPTLPAAPAAHAEAQMQAKPRPVTRDFEEEEAEDGQDEDEGALTRLTLVRAEATGHAVWLQAPGRKARGNQLIYERRAPLSPDMFFFRGDRYTDVEHLNYFADGKQKGQVQSIDRIRTIDVTIYQTGKGPATVIANGPGQLETRAAGSRAIERAASWQDRLVMLSVQKGDQERRQVTLTGNPVVSSPAQGHRLDARDTIVALLAPKAKAQDGPGKAEPPAPDPTGTGDALRIEAMTALNDVRMTSLGPANAGGLPAWDRLIEAKDRLDVEFLEPPPPPAAGPATPSPADALATTAPAAAPAPAAPGADTASAEAAKGGPEADEAKGEEKPEEKAPEPAVRARADRIWAQVQLLPGTNKGEMKVVRLRGDVAIHQDPAPDKERGVDVTGAAVDMAGQGEGRMELMADGAAGRPAVVVTDEMTIRGPRLGLDQSADEAWVEGPGRLTQRNGSGGGLLVADGGKDKKPRANAGPMDITWLERMKFYGRTLDDRDRPGPGQAEFYGKVHAENDESSLDCREKMIAELDRPVALYRPRRDPKAPKPEPEPKPQIVRVRCWQDVVAYNREVEPETGLLLKMVVVEGPDVTYNRLTGHFEVEGAGTVRSYERAKPQSAGPAARPAPAPAPSRRATTTVSGPGRGNATTATARLKPADAKPRDAKKPREKPRPLELTRIRFEDRMKGKFSSDNIRETNAGYREAYFYGYPQVMRAVVEDEDADLDPDAPPAEYMRMTSQALRVASEPPPPGAKTKARTLLDARGDAHANTNDRAIQGDRIKHDSLTDEFLVEGPQHGVIIAQQTGAGQAASYGRGTALLYNHRTGDMTLVNPQTFQFFDPRTAARGGLVEPEKDPEDKKKPRPQLKLPTRSHLERRGFNGR